MICTVITDSVVSRILEILKPLAMAEIRIDLARLDHSQVVELFSSHRCLIATCRPGYFSDEERLELLLAAVNSGAAWVDVEIDAPLHLRRVVRAAAKNKGCRLIISFHDFSRTPGQNELTRLVRRCQRNDADLVKIACQSKTPTEVARLLALYDERYGLPGHMLALSMGRLGMITRLAATIFGAPFTFAAADGSAGTASGQLPGSVMEQIMRYLEDKEEG
jgi:3-dehydroquinate dehydratase-1